MSTAHIPSETVPQTLKRALAAAQIAVKLDEANQDTMAIVEAYQRSISLLDAVISRDPLDDQLTGIRESYRQRIEVLLLSRTVPIVAQQSTETLIKTVKEQSKPWKFPSKPSQTHVVFDANSRRWTVKRLKALCGCTDGSVLI
ncbi:hypothetical protein B0H12DRAFT_1095211 [Mycena haematopus]|nr:hypothetical protein B0H12DRAFT_1095211 [Mycena haematopus]